MTRFLSLLSKRQSPAQPQKSRHEETCMRRHHTIKKKFPVRLLSTSATMVLFCVVALNSILLSRVVLAFVPPQSILRNGETINPRHHYSGVRRLSLVGYDDSYRHGVTTFDNATSVGGDNKRKTKRKNKYQKKRMRGQKRSPIRSYDTSLRPGDELVNRVTKTDLRNQDHITYLKMLNRNPTLVLNADYQPLSALPLSLCSWQETVKSVFQGKVVVVDVYPNVTIRAVNMNIPLPSVVALTDYVSQPSHRPAFTRKNVFLRDGYTCQYCACRHHPQQLSLDHVIPRCRGGRLEWENAVTCCLKCNERKGSRLPTDLRSVGMKLLRTPRIPTTYELAAVAGEMKPQRLHPTWIPFLGMIIKAQDKSYKEETKSFVDDLEMM